MRHTALMLLGGGGAAGIFGDDQVKTQLPGIAGGGFDADVGGDAAENIGVDPAAAQLSARLIAERAYWRLVTSISLSCLPSVAG